MRPTLRRLESQMQPTSGAPEAVDQTSLAQRPRENLLAGSLPYGHGQGTLTQVTPRPTSASAETNNSQHSVQQEAGVHAAGVSHRRAGRDRQGQGSR